MTSFQKEQVPLQWRNLPATAVTTPSELTSPVTGQNCYHASQCEALRRPVNHPHNTPDRQKCLIGLNRVEAVAHNEEHPIK